jgi:hypothetical protein
MARVTKLYKVRDKVTGKYWNGDMRFSKFADTGYNWKKQAAAESAIAFFVRYRSQWGVSTTHSLPEHWEIVEVVLKEVENDTVDISSFLKNIALKTEAEKVMKSAPSFIDVMHGKGVIDQIEFIIKLKPAEGSRYIDMERIMEARAQLRQLGVKTRTFRECNGMFGMMDRQQALRARLVLDVESVVDLGTIRKALNGDATP